jgi:hypothetical protein
MTKEEYIKLFHKEQLNLVAFKRLLDCDEEVLRLVNSAIEAEREACAKIAENRMLHDKNENIKKGYFYAQQSIAQDIRSRGQE